MLGRLAVACRGLKVAAPEVQIALAARLSQPMIGSVSHRDFAAGGNARQHASRRRLLIPGHATRYQLQEPIYADAATDAPVSRVKELKTDQQFESVLADAAKTNALSVFDFTATWCGPCE